MRDDVRVSVVVDCSDPWLLAEFWQTLVGGSVNEVTRSET